MYDTVSKLKWIPATTENVYAFYESIGEECNQYWKKSISRR